MKIGILYSGVGGLSLLREIRKLLPSVDIEYIADSAWCPYGDKSYEEIRSRVFTITDKLIALGCNIVVIACNSATIAAVEALRASYPIPFVGMEPAIKPAAKITKTGVVGILATEASIAGERFVDLVSRHAGSLRVITQPCPKFVTLVEQGITEGEDVMKAIELYTSEMLEKNVDTIVLGCTHYPFLKDCIQKHVGDTVSLIDTGEAVALRIKDLLSESVNERLNKPFIKGNTTVHTSSDREHSETIICTLYHTTVTVKDLVLI